jgi:hypothetical protein
MEANGFNLNITRHSFAFASATKDFADVPPSMSTAPHILPTKTPHHIPVLGARPWRTQPSRTCHLTEKLSASSFTAANNFNYGETSLDYSVASITPG